MSLSNITKQIVGGMKWTGLSTVIITVVQLLQFAILARLLAPSDFGLMSMIMVVIVLSQVFVDMGISSAIIHKQNITRNELSSLYWLNLLVGLLVFGIVLSLTPVIASFFNEPRLKELLVYVSFIFLIIPIGQQFQFLMQKELKFNELAKIEIVSVVSGSFSSIALAFFGYGVLSLIWGQIITSAIKSLYLAFIGWKQWRPSFHFRKSDLEGFIDFGLYQMGSRIVQYIASNIDYMLIGRYLGKEALGVYSLAYQLITIPVTKINPIITKVAFPVFSLNQDDNKVLSKGFLDMTKMLAVVTFPILVGLIAIADILVPVVFGEKWNNSIFVIQILSVLGILRVLMNPNGSVLLAKGKANLIFIWDLFVALINGGAIWFVVSKGIEAVAIVYVLVSMINFILGRKLLEYVIELRAREYLSVLVRPALISVLMGGAVILFVQAVTALQIPYNVLMLSLGVAVGVVVYIIMFYLLDKDYLKQMIGIFIRKKRRREAV
jgi:O-antigen/teichoic acid export membrane protein